MASESTSTPGTGERWKAHYPPYDPSDPKGFSYETVVRRWPIIITGVIDRIHRLNHEATMASRSDQSGSATNDVEVNERIEEGKGIIGKASKLKYDMARDRPMEKIENDGGLNVDIFNAELDELVKEGKGSWFKAPWLFAECYLYRLMRTWFAPTKHWNNFDPFFAQKEDSFRGSAAAVYQLASMMQELESEKEALIKEPARLEVLWDEMIQMCLWGNATDLSLLTNLTHEDIEKLQTVEKETRDARKEFILCDDSDAAWEALKSGSDRVDFILDNAGFEFFTDLVFADFLVTYTPYISRVVFHPKTIPWFVSDVNPPDLDSLLRALSSPSSFFSTPPSPFQASAVSALVSRWKRYFEEGSFSFSVPRETGYGEKSGADFWTDPRAYWNLHLDDPEGLKSLEGCAVVVFKGDLNFRKLTGDVKWPCSTPFAEALGPLRGRIPILSLRTNKADVIVNVSEDVARDVERKDEKWRVNGKYALILFCAKDGV
ncbi:DUF89 domain-containing protein [Sistotremastrum suecicum HHB10207 ss-3]|uniref:Sugar phosphate phosphatase n=1 Tax=Sistotremastrum suecicum HHB10207 ss-3 TaxID=1314776 RepID=A0A166DQ11_9AGAM|nr:DUF89 domain-containing protein [Sistotremastrum suecicum HHB10207 ss-3]